MEIKDYLHLYLGCDVLNTIGNENIVLRLDEVSNGVLSLAHNGFIKPILRPLSDMTEEDFEGFRKVTGYPNHNATFEGADGVLVKYRYGKKSTVNGFKTSISTNQMRPDMFLFLLSKHFDLFGLIDAGLALDKTKLNQQ